MQPYIPSLAAALLYAGGTLYQALMVRRGGSTASYWVQIIGVLALLAQAFGVVLDILPGDGLRLDFFSAANLITTTIIALTLAISVRLPIHNLFMLLFPLGVLTTLTATLLPAGTVSTIHEAPGVLAHILLSITAYGVLTIAMFQSLLVLMQDYHLKSRTSTKLTRSFAPLQTMESLLFGFLWAGWVLLLLSLISGWIAFEDLFAQHLVHKTLLAVLAWVVFGVLLWGRHQLGWRGFKAIRWTLVGFLLLMLAYFGSKLVREFILHI